MLHEKLVITESYITFKKYQKCWSNFQSYRLKNAVLFHRIKSMIFPSFLLPTSTQSGYSYSYEKLLLQLALQTKLPKKKSCHSLHLKQRSTVQSLIHRGKPKDFNRFYGFKCSVILKEPLLFRAYKTEVASMHQACFLVHEERIWSFKAFRKTSISQKCFLN